jgi:hypothetical protein
MMKLLSGLVRNWSNGFVALSQVQDDGIHAGIKFHMEIFSNIFWMVKTTSQDGLSRRASLYIGK